MPMQLTGFDGRVALVTAAGRRRGIGRAIALEFARAGCDVIVTGSGRDPESYPEDEKAVGWRDVESVAAEIRGLGGVDFLINNAALVPSARERVPVAAADPARWTKVIDVNVKGTFHMCHRFGRMLIEQQRGGSNVNITSVAGKRMAPRNTAYGTSQAFLHALTAAMSAEMGEHGIRVNAACLGITDTAAMDEVPRGAAWDAMVKANIPLGRAGRPEDTAAIAVFLCSDQGAFINA